MNPKAMLSRFSLKPNPSSPHGPLTEDELTALVEFFLILDEWDRKSIIT
jgi:hypothetical protein